MEISRLIRDNPGLKSTKQWSQSDSHESIEFEYNRLKIVTDTDQSVNFMSGALKMGLTGLELANNKFGPWLQLDGFSEETTRDMNRYKPALGRIYKQVWRKGTVNPFVELLFLLGGSMVMFHVRNKMFGPPIQAMPQSRSDIPFNLGPFASDAKPETAKVPMQSPDVPNEPSLQMPLPMPIPLSMNMPDLESIMAIMRPGGPTIEMMSS